MSKKPRIVLWDLEVLAIHSKLDDKTWFGIGNWPGRTIKASINSILCFGWKVLGERKTHCVSAWDFPGWRRDVNDDRDVLREAHRVLAGADGLVTHYGKGFDHKFIQARLGIHGLPFLPKIPHADTKQIASSNCLFYSNSLGALAEDLNVPHKKIETAGKNLWMRCRQRDPQAMRLMAAYCRGDVKTLEGVFLELRSLVSAKDFPNYALFSGESGGCPTCGSFDLKKNGFRPKKWGLAQRFYCAGCGEWLFEDKHGELVR